MNRFTDHDSGNGHVGRNFADEHEDDLHDDQGEGFGRQANKGILAERVAEELNVPRRTAARVLDAVLDSVRDLLRTRGKVAVKGFGTFERKVRKGRAYKHPLTGKSIDVADKETILFKPSDQLIEDSRADAAPPQRKKPVGRTEDILFKG